MSQTGRIGSAPYQTTLRLANREEYIFLGLPFQRAARSILQIIRRKCDETTGSSDGDNQEMHHPLRIDRLEIPSAFVREREQPISPPGVLALAHRWSAGCPSPLPDAGSVDDSTNWNGGRAGRFSCERDGANSSSDGSSSTAPSVSVSGPTAPKIGDLGILPSTLSVVNVAGHTYLVIVHLRISFFLSFARWDRFPAIAPHETQATDAPLVENVHREIRSNM